ncbi:MAG: hypothetical protein MZV63_47205 [Marinilabiliales bacterium]|nr:hypothetical protein [Marinilabiliales bacterium]
MRCFATAQPTGAGSFTAAGGTAALSSYSSIATLQVPRLTTAASSVAVTNAGAGNITVRVTDAQRLYSRINNYRHAAYCS